MKSVWVDILGLLDMAVASVLTNLRPLRCFYPLPEMRMLRKVATSGDSTLKRR